MASPESRERALARLVSATQGSYRTAEDTAAAVIRDAIVSGVFAPGERLPQDMLAHLLDVSRMPIRAVLGKLESEGLVELHAHRGASVRALTPEEVSDLYEMRILIEAYALRKTTAAITATSSPTSRAWRMPSNRSVRMIPSSPTGRPSIVRSTRSVTRREW